MGLIISQKLQIAQIIENVIVLADPNIINAFINEFVNKLNKR